MTTEQHKTAPEAVPGRSKSVVATHPQDTDAQSATHPAAATIPLYVLIVETPTDRITRRVYLSLHAAVKACERAQERGHAASIALHRVITTEDGDQR